jgi:hypothetical protein
MKDKIKNTTQRVSDQRMMLRVLYARETNELFEDNIPKYADWLETKLAEFIDKLIDQ